MTTSSPIPAVRPSAVCPSATAKPSSLPARWASCRLWPASSDLRWSGRPRRLSGSAFHPPNPSSMRCIYRRGVCRGRLLRSGRGPRGVSRRFGSDAQLRPKQPSPTCCGTGEYRTVRGDVVAVAYEGVEHAACVDRGELVGVRRPAGFSLRREVQGLSPINPNRFSDPRACTVEFDRVAARFPSNYAHAEGSRDVGTSARNTGITRDPPVRVFLTAASTSPADPTASDGLLRYEHDYCAGSV
jgi:hypothetical protein